MYDQQFLLLLFVDRSADIVHRRSRNSESQTDRYFSGHRRLGGAALVWLPMHSFPVYIASVLIGFLLPEHERESGCCYTTTNLLLCIVSKPIIVDC